MSLFSNEFIKYFIDGKNDGQVIKELEKDSFNLICSMADDLIEKGNFKPEEYKVRILNIANIFKATNERSFKR